MTPEELRAKLNELSDEAYSKLVKNFGGDPRDREIFVGEFVRDSKHERILCDWLGLKTEEEKLVGASQVSAKGDTESAAAARAANRHAAEANALSEKANAEAREANRIAGRANVVAWIALAVSVLAAVAQFGSWLFSRPSAH